MLQRRRLTGAVSTRAAAQDTVNLPARSETNMPGRVVYRDLKDPWETRISVPGAPIEAQGFARTVFSSSYKEIRCALRI